MILNEIIKAKKEILAGRKRKLPFRDLQRMVFSHQPVSLREKLLKEDFSIIAEVKKASPSAGLIRKRYAPGRIARTYGESGAAGISVLTAEPFFLGALTDLAEVRKAVSLPVLQKDFIFDPYQVFEARLCGADAILLIARILTGEQISELAGLAEKLGMETILEVHDLKDLAKISCVRDWQNRILGINNRNLRTLKINLETTFHLLKHLAGDKMMVISESGISTPSYITRLKEHGVQGALVGEALLKNKNVAGTLKELIGRL